MPPSLKLEWIKHHLRLLGLSADQLRQLALLPDPEPGEVRRALDGGQCVVAFQPDSAFCAAFGVSVHELNAPPPQIFTCVEAAGRPWERLRTLHEATAFSSENGERVVTWKGEAVWLWLPIDRGGILFVGTDLASDLLRYRQGDPRAAVAPEDRSAWGFDFERPNHLFEKQLEGESPFERHADWWAEALCEVVAKRACLRRGQVLPEGAPGAIVLTGDDDQAYLEKYDEQLSVLGRMPVTYFLHPLTRHTRKTLQRMSRSHRVELGLHPDALEEPARYGELLTEQVQWFRDLTGAGPASVRNHGFLADGYWRHLPHWEREHIGISSNIPGLNGRILNGSLLPARMIDPEFSRLTSHWSMLTAIGDGVIPVLGLDADQAAECVHALVHSVRRSLPGVIVLNLHPQNVAESRSMHEAALAAVREGFIAWTMGECLDWFARRDGVAADSRARAGSVWSRINAFRARSA